MIELLDRAEIPMQSIDDRNQDISAIVPVHLGAVALSVEAKHDGLDLGAAKRTVAEWYNADMAEYIDYLLDNGIMLHQLKGYEEFQKEWSLDAEPSETGTGFLKLLWREEDDRHSLMHDSIPQPFFNQRNQDGNFYIPEYWRALGVFPLIYRGVADPVVVFMQPEKMKQYGVEVPEMHVVVDPAAGVAEVMGTTFNSDYQNNLAKALLLRNFGVYYANQLASIVTETI